MTSRWRRPTTAAPILTGIPPKSGTTITITVDPEEGYVVEDVTVIVDDTATEVTVTDQGDGTYTFVMPAGDVTVTATYAPSFGPDYTGVSDLLITDQHIRYLNGYPGGTFGPGQKMTRAETAQMFYKLLRDQNVDVTVSFTDVAEDAWYAPAVNALASWGLSTVWARTPLPRIGPSPGRSSPLWPCASPMWMWRGQPLL